MNLLGRWEELLNESPAAPARPLVALPMDIARASTDVRVIDDADDGRRFARELAATPLSAMALSFRSGKAQDALCCDARFARPSALAVAAWAYSAAQGVEGAVVCVVLRTMDRETIDAILHLRVPLVFHDAKPALFALWSLGLDPDLPQIHDAHLTALCLNLGSHHSRAKPPRRDEGESERIRAKEGLAQEKAHLVSLDGQCARYGLRVPFTESDDPRALASRAEATLRLYAAQQPDLVRHGLLQHLVQVEFPFAVANARMEWRGVHVAPDRREALLSGCRRAVEYHERTLRDAGVHPPGSFDALCAAMRRARLEPPGGADDRALKAIETGYPPARSFRLLRRYLGLARADWRAGPDGRIHPEHIQLAAATGRNGCRNPALAGLGRALRPVVTAPAGRGLVELDYSQIEVGIAAAEHQDQDLLNAYHSGDVYVATAQRFYEDELREEERRLAPSEFIERWPQMREAMKTFVLAVLYGIEAPALASSFGISVAVAEQQRQKFLGLFPRLAQGLEDSVALGAARGYASIVSGLRRRTDPQAPECWQRNWLRNTPIQGGATVVFKQAVADLDRAFRGTGVWLVIQVHDSVLIECPIGEIKPVAERAATIMRDALRRWYPALQPKVDVNLTHPSCWNEGGHAESLDRFLEDPDYRIGDRPREDPAAWEGLGRWVAKPARGELLVVDGGVAL